MENQDVRRLYSWWWDSHIPKSSKWLQDNLNEMDTKVETMIELIEGDAESFAKRAEMYYQKRPQLMMLLKEFHGAYRALAERYDQSTGELHKAHRTMAQLPDDSLPGSLGPDGTKPLTPESESQNVILSDLEHSGKGEIEVEETLKIILEKELNHAQDDAREVDEKTSKGHVEIEVLKEELEKLKTERDSSLVRYNHCSERISNLETMISQAQENAKGLCERASKAETEVKAFGEHVKENETVQELQERSNKFELCEAKMVLLPGNEEQMNLEMDCQLNQTIKAADGISELQEMQTGMKAVVEVGSVKIENVTPEAEDSNQKSISHLDKDFQYEEMELEDGFSNNPKLKSKSEDMNRTIMKGIPLDQVSECSFDERSRKDNADSNNQMVGLRESVEQGCTHDPIVNDTPKQVATQIMENIPLVHSNVVDLDNPSSESEVEKELGLDKLEVSSSKREPNKETNKLKILERLASNAQKLKTQRFLQDFKRKMEMMKKRSNKEGDPEYERVKRKSQEVEGAVVLLTDIDDQLTKHTEESSASTVWPRKESDKISRLQLIKLEDENKTKGKYKFWGSRTGVLLMNSIYGDRTNRERRTKTNGCLCGLMRPSVHRFVRGN